LRDRDFAERANRAQRVEKAHVLPESEAEPLELQDGIQLTNGGARERF
jgi:hypothetical protein